MKVVPVLFALVTLVACDAPSDEVAEISKDALQSTVKQKYIQDSRPDIGRFTFVPASGEYPPMLIDTATGCIEVIEMLTYLDNPSDKRVARKFADSVLANTTYVDGKPVAVSGTEPPQRCLTFPESEQ